MSIKNRFTLTAVAAGFVFPVAAVAGTVRLEQRGEAIDVAIDGEPFTAYRTSRTLPKPFFAPVRSAGGAIVTRDLTDPEDHPHHKGVWIAVDEVSGVKFWMEEGRIENQRAELLVPEGDPARMRVVNHWLGADGKPLLVETTEIDIHGDRLLAFDIRLTPASAPVTFGDTKEGFFAIRLADTMRESEGGHVLNAGGAIGAENCWGKPARWIDYYGAVDSQTHGVAIFDHPDNARAGRYHVRGYGLFGISPFGQQTYSEGKLPADPLRLQAGQAVRLRYGLYVHPGDANQARVADVYDTWLDSTRQKQSSQENNP